MTIIQAIILAIIEGITEFLPISSTGHLILTATLLNVPQTEFTKSFQIFIQLGAILAVAVLYAKMIIENTKLIRLVLTAFLPTAVIGLILYKPIKFYLLGNPYVVVYSLIIGGILLIALELFLARTTQKQSAGTLSYTQAILIGLAQSVSVIPGVSRAAATIVGGLLTGMSRKDAVEFSFLLAIPTMAAAAGYDLAKSYGSFAAGDMPILLMGFVVSAITAFITVQFFLRFIRSHSFISFGIYRIVIGLLFLFFVL